LRGDYLKKLSSLFVKFLAIINALEGVIHIIVSIIGFWGASDVGVWDWRLLAPSIENLVFGVLSIATGIVLGKGILHHHHH
jgi:hypothetical protein